MPDLRELLDEAAPEAREIEIAPIRRHARRRRALPRVAAASVVLAVAGAGLVVATSGGDSTNRINTGTAPTTVEPSTTVPPTTTTEVPATTTTAPPPSIPLGENRLSSESRLGYAGLGPIKLGMNFDEAVAAAHVTVQTDPTCAIALHGEPGSGAEDGVAVFGSERITIVEVDRPGIRTISGIQVGSARSDVIAAYPFAVDAGSTLQITGPQGAVITFVLDPDGDVNQMGLAANLDAIENYGRC